MADTVLSSIMALIPRYTACTVIPQAAQPSTHAPASSIAADSAYAAASARKTLQIKIIDYGISLIEEVKA